MWGGHMWEDNIKTHRFIYSYSADFSTPPFYDADLVKADEVKSYDDFLQPKWKGKMVSSNRAFPAPAKASGDF